jgi:raffinose/stachyose/melibiose transport system substrate-binding protein
MIKKAISLGLALILTASVFTGCGSKASGDKAASSPSADNGPEKETKITFFYSIGDPLFKQIVEDRTAAFTKKNPKIKIENISINSGTYLDALKTKDAVGEFPDMLEARDVPTWVRAGKLAEVSPELTALIDNPPLLNGKAYCVPMAAVNTLGVFYNAKLFKDNGFTEPKTYKEFLDLCEKIKAKGIAPLVVGDKDVFHVGFLWNAFWTNGPSQQNQNWISDRYQGKVKFTDQNVADAFKQYTDLFKKGYVEPGFMSTADNQIASVLVSGKAAMFYSGTHMFKQIADADPKFEMGWFPLPDNNGKVNLIAGPLLQGWGYSVNADKDADKKKAVTAFIKFWFEKDNYVDYLQQMSALPTTKEKLDIKYPIAGMSNVLNAINKANYKEAMWNQKWGENEIPSAFRNFAYKVAQEWATGSTSVEDGLKKLDAEWDVESKDFNPTKK